MCRYLLTFYLFCFELSCFGQSGILETPDRLIEEARSNFLINELNLQDFLVQVDGRHLIDRTDTLQATEWSSLVLRSGKSILLERKISPFHGPSRMRRKLGILVSHGQTHTIGGLEQDAEVQRYQPENSPALRLYYDVNPLQAMFHMPNGLEHGDASILKKHTPFLDLEFISAELTENGVKGFFAISRQHGLYETIEFSRKLNWMPTKIEMLYKKGLASPEGASGKIDDAPDLKHLSRMCVNRVIWSEPKSNLYTPSLLELEYKSLWAEESTSMQLKFTWFDVERIDKNVFSPEFLQDHHRSEAFTKASSISSALQADDDPPAAP